MFTYNIFVCLFVTGIRAKEKRISGCLIISKGSDSGGQMASIYRHLSFIVSLHVKIIPKKNLKNVVYMSNATMDMPCPLFVDESHVSGIRIPCTLISHPDSSWLHVVTANKP